LRVEDETMRKKEMGKLREEIVEALRELKKAIEEAEKKRVSCCRSRGTSR